MELDQLRAFLTLAQAKNFSRAAEILHLVQSSVSTRIQVLEEQVGRPLFTRDNRKVELTPAGHTLLPYAQRILGLRDEGMVKVRSVGVFDDKISVGATDSLWRHLVRPVLLDFASQYRNVSLLTRTSHSWEVVQYLLDDVIQLGFVYQAPSVPGVDVITFYEDDIILVACKSLGMARKQLVTKTELAKLPFISLEWDGPLQNWTKAAMPADYFPQIQLDQLSMLVTFVLSGKGVAFVPRCTVAEELRNGSIIELPLAKDIRPPRRRSYVIFRHDKREWPVITAWLGLLKKHGFRLEYRRKRRRNAQPVS